MCAGVMCCIYVLYIGVYGVCAVYCWVYVRSVVVCLLLYTGVGCYMLGLYWVYILGLYCWFMGPYILARAGAEVSPSNGITRARAKGSTGPKKLCLLPKWPFNHFPRTTMCVQSPHSPWGVTRSLTAHGGSNIRGIGHFVPRERLLRER